MKKFAITFFLIFQTSWIVLGQITSYRSSDGTTVDIQIISSNPDSGRNACIYIGRFGIEGSHLIGANYYRPNKFFINGLFGSSGGTIDLSLLLLNKIRYVKTKETVKSSFHTKYYIKTTIPSNLSFGPHIGTSYTDYSKLNFKNEFGVDASYYPYSTMSVFGGFSLLGSKHISLKRMEDGAKGQGTVIHRINADGIFYFNTKFPEDYNGDVTVAEVSRKIGCRIYYDAKATLWGQNGRLSMNYMIGVGINSQKEGFPLFLGLGLGYNFL